MNHVDVGQPFRREEREQVICMNCGQKKDRSEFHKASLHTDGKQSWCKECFKKNAPDKVAERIAEADVREKREVLVAQHERGRHEPDQYGPIDACPLCRPAVAL